MHAGITRHSTLFSLKNLSTVAVQRLHYPAQKAMSLSATSIGWQLRSAEAKHPVLSAAAVPFLSDFNCKF